MKIHYNSKIAKAFTFLNGYKTIMLFGQVYSEKPIVSKTTMYHEAVHVEQFYTLFNAGIYLDVVLLFLLFGLNSVSWWMLSLLIIPLLLFYVWYLIEYSIRFLISVRRLSLKDAHTHAYRSIGFEKEAYDLQYEYLKVYTDRREAYSFSFLRYM